MKKLTLNKILIFIGLFGLLIFSSCRKFPDPPLVFEEEPQTVVKKDRKVLLIVIEGLNGIELGKETPATIKNMLEHSKYTLTGLSDGSKYAQSWSNILSGQWSDIHNIHEDSFDPSAVDDDDIHNHEGTGGAEGFVSIFQRVNEAGKKLTSSAITSSSELNKYAFQFADNLKKVENDMQAKETAIQVIKNMDKQQSLAVLQFADVRVAGTKGGFSITNASYKAAIQKTDSYIKELLDSIKARSTYEKEDWLVILTSNHGGIQNSYGGKSFEELNTFTLFYHPKFKPEMISADLMNYIRYHGWYQNETITTNSKSMVVTEMGVHAVGKGAETDDVFNIAKTGELTIEFKANFNKPITVPSFSAYVNTYSFWYQNVISKDLDAAGWTTQAGAIQTPGWAINVYSTDSYGITLQDGKVSKSVRIPGRKNQTWQHVSITAKKVGEKTLVTGYVDGIKTAQEEVDINVNNLSNIDPLVLGFNRRFQYGLLDFYMADIRFWNKALSDAEVSQAGCLSEIKNDHPLFANMISFYKKSNQGALINDKANGSLDLTLTGGYEQNTAFNYSLCSKTGTTPYSIVDIAPQIFYWLDIPINEAWKLSGKQFLGNYEIEFMQEQPK